jgi:U3 small nucleolar RNA-associated protein 10
VLPHLQKGYLDAIATVLSSPTTPRQLTRIHLTFLSHHFVKAYPSTVNVVVERCLWPFLLFTKAKQMTSSAVWDILGSEGCSDEITDFQLLRGCPALVCELERNFAASQGEGGSNPGLRKLAAIGAALASRISGVFEPSPFAWFFEKFVATENIMLSENPSDHVDFVLGALKDENHNARALGYLVTRALLAKLSGQYQLSVAQRAIQAMAVETLSGMEDFMKGSDNLQSVRCFFRLRHTTNILVVDQRYESRCLCSA